ncbi:AAA family ATPase [Deinococcus lacus]|uniref:AAA family ATPase n=1 Tax=Deinococcus lacus TaxID=392561 RepID=A0ABW1YDF7_9DEIO
MIHKLTQLPNIGEQHAARLIRHLGHGSEARAIEAVKVSPYSMTTVPRIGFKIADGVARYLGVHPDSPGRHEAGNRFILGEDGTLPTTEFDEQRRKLDLACHALRRQGVVEESGRVWLPEVLRAEEEFAAWVAELPLGHPDGLTARAAADTEGFDLDSILTTETAPLAHLDEHQGFAAGYAVYGAAHVMAITGGGGTGKTAVIGGIVGLCQQAGKLVAVAAFAGKAADRVRETLAKAKVSATYAGTIHRLLNYTGYEFRTGTLPHDVVILEEASMIPTMLLWEVVKRLKPGARLILVGDDGQLPPVGYGQPYKDLLALGVPSVHLSVNYRSQNVQGIINAANAVRQGRMLQTFTDDSFSVRVATDLSEPGNAALEGMRGVPQDEWQLITWKNDDAVAFNLAIQEALNPDGFPLFSFRVFGQDRAYAEVREGDKVMVKANDPDLGIFNGQLGTALTTLVVQKDITRLPDTLEDWAEAEADGLIHNRHEELCVRVKIGDELVDIPEKDAPALLTLGYAITVHKAQGSDWEHVLIYQPGAIAFDAQRWWYTSITRAKTKCTVLYEVKVKDPASALNLWWANTRRTMELGPSIFVGRVRKLLHERQQRPPDTRSAAEIGKEWLGL